MFAATCLPRFPLDQRALGKRFIFTPMPKESYYKLPISYQDQLQQLKNRGLVVENEEHFLHLLEVKSYYRLSAYWFPLLKDKVQHQFKDGASFNNAYKMYCFDRELRHLVLAELENIEVQ